MSLLLLLGLSMLDAEPRASLMQPLTMDVYKLPMIEVFARPRPGPRIDLDNPNQGRRLLQAERYADAYHVLSRTARAGNKVDQYLLGMMYLKGLHVEQQPLLGYSWMKLSLTDSHTRRWRHQVEMLESLMTAEEEAQAATLIANLSAHYGNEALGVRCYRERRFNSYIRHDACYR